MTSDICQMSGLQITDLEGKTEFWPFPEGLAQNRFLEGADPTIRSAIKAATESGTVYHVSFTGECTSEGEEVEVTISDGRNPHQSFFIMGNVFPGRPSNGRDLACIFGLVAGAGNLAGGLARPLVKRDETITSIKPLAFMTAGTIIGLASLLAFCHDGPPPEKIHRTTRTKVEDLGRRHGTYRERVYFEPVGFKLPELSPESVRNTALIGAMILMGIMIVLAPVGI